jgi:HEPN domain-containing protein
MDERETLARAWFIKAEDDLRSAEHLLTMAEPAYGNVGFHAQQCAEKYLKGYLVFHGIAFKKWHDLGYLIDLCTSVNPRWEQFYNEAEFLSPFAAEYRYPDLLIKFTCEQAERSINIARQIRQAVLDELGASSPRVSAGSPESI